MGVYILESVNLDGGVSEETSPFPFLIVILFAVADKFEIMNHSEKRRMAQAFLSDLILQLVAYKDDMQQKTPLPSATGFFAVLYCKITFSEEA